MVKTHNRIIAGVISVLLNGNTAYWNHGDWMTGDGLSRFPHINYSMDGGNTIGHIFLKDKIKKNGMWDEFISEIESWKK
jgi:hypothetical protein